MSQNVTIQSQNVTKCENVPTKYKYHKMPQKVTKCHKMSQNVTKCHKMSQNVTKCHKIMCFLVIFQCILGICRYLFMERCLGWSRLSLWQNCIHINNYFSGWNPGFSCFKVIQICGKCSNWYSFG
jgi:hypothetical protein